MNFRLLAPTLLVVTAAGCIEHELVTWESVDVFYQKPADQVDILLVVDNSCSMADYQQKLGDNFNQFIQSFIDANIDYQIGVTTTTIDRPEYDPLYSSECPQSALDAIPDPGHLVEGLIINNTTENASDRFQELVNVGTCGDAFERGLEAAARALSPSALNTANAGFLREEASMSIIFVSDEQDGSPDPVNDYINNFFDVKGDRSRDVFNASALTVTDITACDPGVSSTAGTRYEDVANQTGGIIGNLCSEDFSSIVTELSLNASRLRATYFLSRDPDLGTLRVAVEDENIPCEDGAWWYDRVVDDEGELAPAVIFDPFSMPQPGEQIAIRYNAGDGDPATFCNGAETDTTGATP